MHGTMDRMHGPGDMNRIHGMPGGEEMMERCSDMKREGRGMEPMMDDPGMMPRPGMMHGRP
jgi:hypothetical protein